MKNTSFLGVAFSLITISAISVSGSADASGLLSVKAKGFYVANAFTTAPLTLCDLDIHMDRTKSSDNYGCADYRNTDRNPIKPETPKEYLYRKCPGALLNSYKIVQGPSVDNYTQVVLSFLMPDEGCREDV